jgi:spermidine synthase
VIKTEVLARVASAIGELVLSRRGPEFSLRVGGNELMNSRNHHSEDVLGQATCARIAGSRAPRVLIGGLGFGYTLRAALDALPADARVEVVELVPEVIAWNRGVLGPLANHPLADPRVEVVEADVADVIARGAGRYHAILLDVDNGPDGMHPRNTRLYRQRGLAAMRAALAPGGVLAVWSSFASSSFTRWLRDAGFAVDTETIRAKHRGGPRHYLWFARAAGQG